MANETIEIDILINASESAGSVNELKQSLKDLRNAAAEAGQGSEDFDRLSKAAGEVKNKIDDVNASIKSQSGEGIEKITGSFGLLGDKLKALDFKGAAAATKGFAGNIAKVDIKSLTSGLGSFVSSLGTMAKALLANPIFLLAAVIVGIALATKAWVDNEQAKAIEAVNKLGDAIKYEIDQIEFLEQKLKTANKNELALLAARGADQITLEKATLEAIKKERDQAEKDRNDLLAQQLEHTKVYLASTSDEEREELDKSGVVLQEALTAKSLLYQQYVADVEIQQAKIGTTEAKNAEEAKKEEDKKQKDLKKIRDDAREEKDKKLAQDAEDTRNALDQELKYRIDSLKGTDEEEKRIAIESIQTRINLGTATRAEIDALAAYEKEVLDKSIADQREAYDEKIAIEQSFSDARIAGLNSKDEKEREINEQSLTDLRDRGTATQEELDALSAYELQKAEETAATKKEIADTAFNAAKGLSDALFAISLANVEKGSAAELRIRKKQFAVDKAFSVARAVIDGIRSVQAALTIPPPGGTVLAVLNGVVAAANVAKILATQFDGGGGGSSGGGASVPSGGGDSGGGPQGSTPFQPGFKAPELFAVGGGAGSTAPKPPVVKAIVVSSDITKEQGADNILERRASY